MEGEGRQQLPALAAGGGSPQREGGLSGVWRGPPGGEVEQQWQRKCMTERVEGEEPDDHHHHHV